jgi:uncharacterized membrane protein
MLYRILADFVVVVHFVFVLFTVFGGVLVLWRRRFAWIHIPSLLWGALIEFAGWICPLTPLEILLLEKGGAGGYPSGFIEHYIIPLLYPTDLTRDIQVVLGFLVLIINLLIYGWLLKKTLKSKK